MRFRMWNTITKTNLSRLWRIKNYPTWNSTLTSPMVHGLHLKTVVGNISRVNDQMCSDWAITWINIMDLTRGSSHCRPTRTRVWISCCIICTFNMHNSFAGVRASELRLFRTLNHSVARDRVMSKLWVSSESLPIGTSDLSSSSSTKSVVALVLWQACYQF